MAFGESIFESSVYIRNIEKTMTWSELLDQAAIHPHRLLGPGLPLHPHPHRAGEFMKWVKRDQKNQKIILVVYFD